MEDGAPKYFYNRTYPIDIHSVDQSIITLVTFKDLDTDNVGLAHDLYKWAIDNMWKDISTTRFFPFSRRRSRI
jgi:hypothetical protein